MLGPERVKIPSLQKMAFQALCTAAPRLNFADEFSKATGHINDFGLLTKDYKARCAMDATIERMVSDYYGYIFGGYVRDMIAGIVRNDIDIRFPRRSDIDAFFLDLSKIFIVSPIDKSNKRMYNLLLSPVVHLVVVDKDVPDRFVYLDITNDQDHGGMRYDFDVNTLSLKNGRIVYPPKWNTLQEQLHLQRSCVNQQMTMFNNNGLITERHYTDSDCIYRETYIGSNMIHRICNFEQKGWTIRGKGECENVHCVLSDDTKWGAFVIERKRQREKAASQRKAEWKEFTRLQQLASRKWKQQVIYRKKTNPFYTPPWEIPNHKCLNQEAFHKKRQHQFTKGKVVGKMYRK